MVIKMLFAMCLAIILFSNISFAKPTFVKRETNMSPQSENAGVRTIVDTLTGGTNILKTLTQEIAKTAKAIIELMNNVEKKLIAIRDEIGIVSTERNKLTREAIDTYQQVTHKLRVIRHNLKSLAYKTVIACEELSIYMESWDNTHGNYSVEEQKQYLEEQLRTMKKLMKESKTTLGDAKVSYHEAIEQLEEMDSRLDLFQRGIEKMMDDKSDEHKRWTNEIRAGFYTSAGATTVGMIFADIFGCMGFCSGIITSVTWIGSVAAVESGIAKVTAALEKLDSIVTSAIENVDHTRGQINDIQVFLESEVEIIAQWLNTVENMDNKIKRTKEERFYTLPLFRKAFQSAVDLLKHEAQVFLDQPDLWSTFPKPTAAAQEAEEQAYAHVETLKSCRIKCKASADVCAKKCGI